jgi:hypothetical protein
MKTCCQTAQSAGPPAQLHDGGVGPLSTPPPEPEPELEPEEEPELEPEEEPELEPEEEPELEPEEEPELEPEEEPEPEPEEEPELEPEPEPPEPEPDPEDAEPESAPATGSEKPEQACIAATAKDVASQARNHPFRMQRSPAWGGPRILVNTPNERKASTARRPITAAACEEILALGNASTRQGADRLTCIGPPLFQSFRVGSRLTRP